MPQTPCNSSSSRPLPGALFVLMAVALFVSIIANVCLGSTLLPFGEVVSSIFGIGENQVVSQVVWDFRMPRAITALLAGSALAVSGLLMQTVFRNPLADPFVLGVNSGASLGVAIVVLVIGAGGITIAEDLTLTGKVLLVVGAAVGAGSVLMLILGFARKVDVMTLLILGLMMSYGIGAVVSILMFYSMPDQLQSFFAWSFGDFGNVTWSQMVIFAPTILLGLSSVLLFIKALDSFLLGESYAASLGTRVKPVRFGVLGIASVLAGTVTGFCGPIGFLGIAAPHLCRSLYKTASHRALIPGSILLGGTLAVLADLISKAPGFDAALPVNAITALVGAPIIIGVLLRQRSLKKVFG